MLMLMLVLVPTCQASVIVTGSGPTRLTNGSYAFGTWTIPTCFCRPRRRRIFGVEADHAANAQFRVFIEIGALRAALDGQAFSLGFRPTFGCSRAGWPRCGRWSFGAFGRRQGGVCARNVCAVGGWQRDLDVIVVAIVIVTGISAWWSHQATVLRNSVAAPVGGRPTQLAAWPTAIGRASASSITITITATLAWSRLSSVIPWPRRARASWSGPCPGPSALAVTPWASWACTRTGTFAFAPWATGSGFICGRAWTAWDACASGGFLGIGGIRHVGARITGGGFILMLGCAAAGLAFAPAGFAFIKPGRINLLAGSQPTQFVEFLAREVSPGARLEPLQGERPDGHSVEPHHLVAELRPHASDFAVLPFGQDHFDLGGISDLAHHADPSGSGFTV